MKVISRFEGILITLAQKAKLQPKNLKYQRNQKEVIMKVDQVVIAEKTLTKAKLKKVKSQRFLKLRILSQKKEINFRKS